MTVTAMPKTDPAAGKPGADAGGPEKKSKKKLLLIVLVLVLVAGAAGWWFLLRPAPAEKEPEPGEVMALESIQINLAGGHYLKIGIALQASADLHEELDGSKALDATIELFSGQPISKLTRPDQRHRLKEKLAHELEERYHGEVLDVYFTDFVTQ